jgi:hypothetical protein
MSSRNTIEDALLSRLTRPLPGELEDWEVKEQFERLYPAFKVAMDKVLRRTTLSQFCDDDLRGFFLLRAHQVLRRGQYDESRNPYSFFYTVFNNLMLDIRDYQGRKKYIEMGHDPFESSYISWEVLIKGSRAYLEATDTVEIVA